LEKEEFVDAEKRKSDNPGLESMIAIWPMFLICHRNYTSQI